jgi:hypothetical protein
MFLSLATGLAIVTLASISPHPYGLHLSKLNKVSSINQMTRLSAIAEPSAASQSLFSTQLSYWFLIILCLPALYQVILAYLRYLAKVDLCSGFYPILYIWLYIPHTVGLFVWLYPSSR